MNSQFLLIALLLVVSAFFSMAEIALASARRIRLQLLDDAGHARAREVIALQEHPGHFFTAVQIGLNTVAILGGMVGEGVLSPYLEAALLGLGADTQLAQRAGFFGSFALVTALFILFADLVPRRVAMAIPERVALGLVRPMQKLVWLLRPIVWVFDSGSNLLIRVAGLPATREEAVTADDIAAVVDAGAESGALQLNEYRFIENILSLSERGVAGAMTPRDAVLFLSADEDSLLLRHKILSASQNRFLLCDGQIDRVLGYLQLSDVLPLLAEHDDASLGERLGRLTPAQPLIVPDTLNLADTLDRFRESRTDFAVVVNEYALVVGVVTITDVMHTLMDNLAVPQEDQQIVRRDEHSWLIDGVTPIQDVKRLLDLDSVPGEEGYDTVAGFMMTMLKRIPKRADGFDYAGYRFEAVDIDNYKIDQILVSRIAPAEPGDDARSS